MKRKRREKAIAHRTVPCPIKLRIRISEHLRRTARDRADPTRAKRAAAILAAIHTGPEPARPSAVIDQPQTETFHAEMAESIATTKKSWSARVKTWGAAVYQRQVKPVVNLLRKRQKQHLAS